MEQEDLKNYSWAERIIHKGMQYPGTRLKYEFVYTGDQKIDSITPYCGCTSYKLKPVNKDGVDTPVLEVIYTVEDKPPYFPPGEFVPISKHLRVTYEDGLESILTIKATVV